MAIRNVRIIGDELLRKKSKDVLSINDSVLTLLDDMADTMYEQNGVGIAAVQVGILKRIIVIDIGEGIVELINPVIVEQSGSQIESEGCLSIPGVNYLVDRPSFVKVRALNRDAISFELDAVGYMAIAVSHEMDHLDGILFTDKAIIDLPDQT